MEDWVRSLFGLAGGLALFLYGMTTRILNIIQYNGDVHIVFYWKGNAFLWNITDYEREK